MLKLFLGCCAQAIEDALAAGIDRFSFHDRDTVKAAMKDLRLGNALAREILDACARKSFQGFITRSRSHRNRLDSAKELKKLVFYSNIVVAALLEDVKVSTGRPITISSRSVMCPA